MRTITLTIEIPDDVTTIENLAGVAVHLRSDIDPEVAEAVVMASVEAAVRRRLIAQAEEEDPYEDSAHIRESAALASRLLLVDTVMHLPTTEAAGFTIEV